MYRSDLYLDALLQAMEGALNQKVLAHTLMAHYDEGVPAIDPTFDHLEVSLMSDRHDDRRFIQIDKMLLLELGGYVGILLVLLVDHEI